MILPTNLEINKNLETDSDTTSITKTATTLTTLTTNIDILDKSAIKKETYYKMKYIMNSLDKNWAIKKRENIFYLKNLDNSTKDIITEDYLNKRVIQKIYSEQSTTPLAFRDNIDKSCTTIQAIQAIPTIPINGKNPKKKEDIISLKDGILAIKDLINKESSDINKELRQEIYIMIFLMNALEGGWSIRKKENNFVFRKKHNHKKEIYSDDYLVNFLKTNLKNIIF